MKVAHHIHTVFPSAQTLQILVGLLNIGLGVILRVSDVYMYPVMYTLFPVWLGVLVSNPMECVCV